MKKFFVWGFIALFGFALGFIASAYRNDIPAEIIKEKYSYSDSHFFELDGMEVHYRIVGDTGETIVLLHGTAASLHTWEGWTKELSEHYRVVSFDLPGFGLTGPEPDNVYTRERYVKFIHDVLQHLQIEDCHMAGNSFGGYLAWNYAVSFPNEVKTLGLLDASGYPRGDQPTPVSFKMQNQKWLKPILEKITPRTLIKRSVETVYFDNGKITEAQVDRYYELLLREGNRGGLMGKSIQIKQDNSEDIKKVACPTLIMWGADDNLVWAKDAPKFHADIPNSELLIYEEMGHIPMEEIPVRSANDYMAFLQR